MRKSFKKLSTVIISLCITMSLCLPMIITASANQISGSDFVSADDISDPYLYNVVVSNNHSANQADTEGGLAIGNASYLKCVNGNTFTYGAYFSDSSNGLGDQLSSSQKVSLLIGDKVYNYSDPLSWNGSTGIIGSSGYFIMSEGVHNNWLPDAKANYTISHNSLNYYDTNIDKTLNTLNAKVNYIASEYVKIIAETESTSSGLSLNEIGGCTITEGISAINSKVLVIKVEANSEGEAFMPAIKTYLSKYEKIIVTTDAEKVGMIDNDTVANTNEAVKDIAYQVDYYLPNAKVVMNYSKYGQAWGVLPGLYDYDDDTLNNPVSETKDYFDSDYFTYSYGTMVTATNLSVGSIIAPDATVIWSGGSINGNVFVKNFHHRNGAEAHNFVSKSIVDFDSMPEEFDTSKLEDLVEQAESLEEDDYTSNSWDIMSGLLRSARLLLDSISNEEENITQDDIDILVDKLEKAIDKLEPNNPSSSPSESSSDAPSESSSESPSESSEAPSQGSSEAPSESSEAPSQGSSEAPSESSSESPSESSSEPPSESSSEPPSESSSETPSTSSSGASSGSSSGGGSSMETKKLEDLIKQAESLVEDDYTPTSWDTMSNVLRRSRLLLDSISNAQSVVQEDIDSLAEELEKAINELEPINSTSSGSNSLGSSSGSTESSESSTNSIADSIQDNASSESTNSSDSSVDTQLSNSSSNNASTGDIMLAGLFFVVMACIVLFVTNRIKSNR